MSECRPAASSGGLGFPEEVTDGALAIFKATQETYRRRQFVAERPRLRAKLARGRFFAEPVRIENRVHAPVLSESLRVTSLAALGLPIEVRVTLDYTIGKSTGAGLRPMVDAPRARCKYESRPALSEWAWRPAPVE